MKISTLPISNLLWGYFLFSAAGQYNLHLARSDDCTNLDANETETQKTPVIKLEVPENFTSTSFISSEEIHLKISPSSRNDNKSTLYRGFDNNEPLLRPLHGKYCGWDKCSDNEICVSWRKRNVIEKRNSRRHRNSFTFHECFHNDGQHWNKMNPTRFKLCGKGKTHAVIDKGQDCLRHRPPCELIWEFNCVNEMDSPHLCSLKKCPKNRACIEIIHCDLQPPCYVQAICTPVVFNYK